MHHTREGEVRTSGPPPDDDLSAGGGNPPGVPEELSFPDRPDRRPLRDGGERGASSVREGRRQACGGDAQGPPSCRPRPRLSALGPGSLREPAILQTFPRSYTFSGNYGTVERQSGNAVLPKLTTAAAVAA